MPSLLVTNDFPPKVGGIQSYLYELWRRLPPAETTVLTTPYAGAAAWDALQPFRVVRTKEPVLLPTGRLARDIDALAHEVRAEVIFVDPMLPLGLLASKLRAAPFVVVTHGAEITVPERVPGARSLGARVLHAATALIAAGGYPAAQACAIAGRPVPGVVIPPGVDAARFTVPDEDERTATRVRFGLHPERPLVLGLSRLVPRKGFDVVIDACRALGSAQLAIAGAGRDRRRLERRAQGAAQFLGRVPDELVPALYGCADVFAMCCRDRWFGFEAEGFGIVFLEAGACGVPSVAGRSGGAHEAVADGVTGYVVEPRDRAAVRDRLHALTEDSELRRQMGRAARNRAAFDFSYDRLVSRLAPIAAADFSMLEMLSR